MTKAVNQISDGVVILKYISIIYLNVIQTEGCNVEYFLSGS